MKMSKFFMFLCLMFVPFFAFAQDGSITTDEFLLSLFHAIGGLKGMGAMGIAVVVVQLAMQFFKSPLAAFAGKYKLLAVMGLSLAAGILGLMSQGVSLSAALINSTTLAAAQVFLHQVYVQFFKKEQA